MKLSLKTFLVAVSFLAFNTSFSMDIPEKSASSSNKTLSTSEFKKFSEKNIPLNLKSIQETVRKYYEETAPSELIDSCFWDEAEKVTLKVSDFVGENIISSKAKSFIYICETAKKFEFYIKNGGFLAYMSESRSGKDAIYTGGFLAASGHKEALEILSRCLVKEAKLAGKSEAEIYDESSDNEIIKLAHEVFWVSTEHQWTLKEDHEAETMVIEAFKAKMGGALPFPLPEKK